MARDVIAIRSATVEECRTVAHMCGELHRMHQRLRPDSLRQQPPVAEILQMLLDALDDYRHTLLVAERGGQIVGYIWCHLRESPATAYEIRRCDLVIGNISVEPHHRRLGIATRLEGRPAGHERPGADEPVLRVPRPRRGAARRHGVE